ncbi:MAG TPA: PQQ-binding-like beta-propeller repeat protein, partial [Isosphaeraceae bacterium]
RSASFEGTPVADARGVYVVLTDRSEMTSTYVACLDSETGNPRWVRYICEANTTANFQGSSSPEINHRLLALDGPTIYYQTNLGAVVALDVEAGGIRWMASYPWQGRGVSGEGQERDLNPAVVHDGLVIVAPDDTPSIYAFDAATGRMVWKTRPVPEVRLAHLLGVAKGHVVATGDRVLLYDVKTGMLARAWPEGAQTPQGYGRGLLAGDRIYWPTRTEIHVLDQETGARADAPIKLQSFQANGGNLAVGDGFLVVAGAESMVVFCQNRRLMERYRDEIARAPEKAANYYRLAQAAEASGLDDEALENFDQVLRRARPSETIDGLALVESARDHQHHLLMKQGDRARKAGDLARASERFARAAETARGDRDRLAARLELAVVELDAGKPASAVSTYQSLLADEKLRPLVVPAGDGLRSVRADLLIADRLAAIVREHGRAAYGEFDRAAEGLLDRGLKAGDARLLADISRSYPAAKALPASLLALGQLQERAGQPREAARAYKRLLVADVPEDAKARAAWGLARAYESQKLWAPARAAYLQAAGRFGQAMVEGEGAEGRVADAVAARLARAPFDRMPLESPEPPLGLPLRRRWESRWPATIRPLAADGTPPSADQGRIFLVEGTTLRAVDPRTGKPLWSANLGAEPVWAGYLADRLVAASRTKVVALERGQGAIEWQYDPAAPSLKGAAGPFAKGEGAEPAREQGSTQLQDFRVVGGRVVCLRGDQAIVAIDGETGQVDWTYAPSVGRINPRLLAGPERIVLQVRKPNAVFVLDTATGRRRAEFPQGDDDEEWARDPLPIDDDHVALVPDRRTVALLDLNRGKNAWSFRESTELPKHGPPRLVGDAERLLVIQDGTDLIRLDPMTGKKRWSRPIGDDNLAERPDAFVLSGDRFFVANGSDLAALSFVDGTTVWRQKLIGPSTGWSVTLTDRCVVSFPNPARLAGDEEASTIPIVFRRRDTGQLVQRLVFPVPAADLTVRLVPRGAFVATQTGLWALNDRRAAERP